MAIDLQEKITVSYLEEEILFQKNIRLGLLRLDRIHPVVSGNKWFKLKENIRIAIRTGKRHLLTFGGSHSNHLIATAATARAYGLGSTGLIRGFHARENLSPTLKDCLDEGMELIYLSREEYKQKQNVEFLARYQQQFPESYIIPEGGNNDSGRIGAAAIAQFISDSASIVAVPVGTGTTFSGIRNGLAPHVTVSGFPVMKGGTYLQEEINKILHPPAVNWLLNSDYHFGGFARYTPELIDFINRFYARHSIKLDFVYTAKMMYGLYDLIQKDKMLAGSHIIAIHTGGLQGNRSIRHLLEFEI